MTSIARSPRDHDTQERQTGHEHGWLVESRHSTTDGIVLYVRCGLCGVRRVDLQESPHTPPAALSAAVVTSSIGRMGR